MQISKKFSLYTDRFFEEVGPWLSEHVAFSILALVSLPLVLCVIAGSFLHMRVNSIEKELSTHRWKIPSVVYADAPVLRPGMRANQLWLRNYLDKLQYQRISSPYVKSAQYASTSNEICFRGRKVLPTDVEPQPVCVAFQSDFIQRIRYGSKKEVADYRLEPVPISAFFGPDWQKRNLVCFEEIPRHLVDAVIAVEDRRFYQHRGVDLMAIGRAFIHNATSISKMQGGSTITQQLVKNFYLSRERTFRRKASEALMAVVLERKLTKDKILEYYLNEIYLGQRGAISIHGVSEGSRLYFGKDVKHIDVPEAALLAAMIQAPQRYNPYKNPDRAKDRRDTVLAAMRNIGAITQNQYEIYRERPIVLNEYEPAPNEAPYFIDLLDRQLSSEYSSSEIENRNYRIFTSLDLDMQRAAEEALHAGLAQIDRVRYRKAKKHAQGCLIAADPVTGEIKAFVGGRSYSKSQFDRLTQAMRQPGSSFKPIVYAAALESAFTGNGPVFTPATLIEDEPWSVSLSRAVWTPQNYDRAYHGVVTSRIALAESMNVATARLAYEVGLSKITALAKNLGIRNVKPYPSLALGSFEVSPLELIQAYSAFVNRGQSVELHAVKKMTASDGTLLEQRQTRTRRVLHEQTAYVVTDMLRSVMSFGTGSSHRRYGIDQPVAGKTGTTNDYRDAWFIGYTPNLICLVWVGYDDNTPIRMTGGQAALPIWAMFMKKALESLPQRDFAVPDGVVTRLIDPGTGRLASESCSSAVQEIFIQGTEPYEVCNDQYHMMPVEYFTFANARYSDQIQDGSQYVYPEPPVYDTVSQEPEETATYFAAPEKATTPVFTNDAIEDLNNGEEAN